MRMRILAALVFACCAGPARADLINGNFSSGFTGWQTSTTLTGGGSWTAATGSTLVGSVGQLTVAAPNSTISMFQDFQLATLIPGAVTTATLKWDQWLQTDQSVNPHWSDSIPVQQFRVVLSDSTATSFTAFTTSDASPMTIGPTIGQTATGSSLVAFLNQLGVNETIRLSFQALESDFMFAEIDNVSLNFTQNASAVPEPASFLLASIAGSGLLVMRRRHRSTAQKA